MNRNDPRRAAGLFAGGTLVGAAALLGAGALFSRRVARRAERAAPAEGRYLDVAGARLHYVEAGDGPPIVMIHGLGGQLRNFYPVLGRLSTTHRIILVDRPGAGFSPHPAGGRPGIGEHAGVVAALIARLGLARPLIVGHSFGGAVALALAIDHPDAVGALALVAPLSQPDMVIRHPFKAVLALPRPLRRFACATLAVPLAQMIRPRVTRAIFSPEAVVEGFETVCGGGLVARGPTLVAGFEEIGTAAVQLAGLGRRLGEIAVPSAILFGRQDRVIDPGVHGTATAAAIPGCRLELIDGGHMLPLTQPDRVARFIRSLV